MSIEDWIKDTVLELNDDNLWLWWIATGVKNEIQKNNCNNFEHYLFEMIFQILEYGADAVVFKDDQKVKILANYSNKDIAYYITRKWMIYGDDPNGNGIWFVKH